MRRTSTGTSAAPMVLMRNTRCERGPEIARCEPASRDSSNSFGVAGRLIHCDRRSASIDTTGVSSSKLTQSASNLW